MAGNGKRSSASGDNSSLILGILVGMVIGLAIAGGVAWHLSKRPGAFTNKDLRETAPAAAAGNSAPAPQKPTAATEARTGSPAASGVGEGKPRFEFYKILTDKDSPAPKSAGHPANSVSAPKSPAGTPATKAYLVQAGSFGSADDADKLKARLALLGLEANIQSADVPGKGTYYRVRLGPYHSAAEANKANDTLKQNGITDAQVRAQ